LFQEQDKRKLDDRESGAASFGLRWLAESVRVREQAGQLSDEGDATAVAKAAEADTELRIIIRAHHLARQHGTLTALSRWRSVARWMLIGFAVLALVLGFSAALTMIGDGGRPVNIVWTLGALLGLHLLMLLFWLLNMFASGQAAGGVLGRLWMKLMQRAGGDQHSAITRGLIEISLRGRLLRWYASAITHGFWFFSLTAASMALLLALALRSYDFVWETTILSAEVFVRFVQFTGALPATLGFMVPDTAMVMASGNGQLANAVEQELLRRSWSSWLLGCLLVYGVMPRFFLLLLSLLMLRVRQQRTRLDLTAPQWASLAARLTPVSERGGITDPHQDELSAPVLRRDPTCTGAPLVLALELGTDSDWPPAGFDSRVTVAPVVESRQQRAEALNRSQTQRPARLLLVCDARLSPDRGTLRWLADVSANSAASRVCLWHYPLSPGMRRQTWQEALLELGFTDREIITDVSQARAWIASTGEPGHE